MHDTINTIITDLLASLEFEVMEIEHVQDEEVGVQRYVVSIKQHLPDRNGKALDAINYLVKRILEQETGQDRRDLPHFFVDIGNWYGKRIETLKTQAKIVASRAKSFNRSIPLEPMLPYERLIVHAVLADEQGITTGSEGLGKDRHVVVSYKSEDRGVL